MAGNPSIRASDVDRDRIATALRENLAEGRLTIEEFDERLDKALTAKTLGELEGLMTDLPGTGISQRTDSSPDRAGGTPPSRRDRFPAARRTAREALFTLGVLILVIWLISGAPAGLSFLWVVVALAVLVIARRITGGRARGQRRSARPGRPGRHYGDRDDGRAGQLSGGAPTAQTAETACAAGPGRLGQGLSAGLSAMYLADRATNRGGDGGRRRAGRMNAQANAEEQALVRETAAQLPDGRGPASRGPVIEVRGLRKSYDGVDAVAGIDLEVRAGEVFAFLGPNGAGKTTTVEILEGYRRRSAGDVSVLGIDPAQAGRAWRARIGVVLQESEPEAELTAEECLSLYAGYYPSPRPVAETLDLVGLTQRRNARCGQMSGGQRRRLDVALALIGDPELVFLDEPTTGFDPAARQSAWEVIAGLRDLGKTIFLTTHYMEEAERLADRIAVLAAGRIVAEGTAATLGGRDTEASIVSFTLPSGLSAADLPPPVAACVARGAGGRVEADTVSPLSLLGALAGWAHARGIDLPDLEVHRPTLEDVYLQLTRESR